MNQSNLLIVVSGPSGVGKGTVVKKLLTEYKNLELSVSATTRKPRNGEIDGVNYYFKTPAQFADMLKRGEFLENFEIYGNQYGTLKNHVFERMELGKDVLLEIDIQGGLEVKRRFPDAVLIFLLPPSIDVLRNRLLGRESETPESLRIRTNAACDEIKTCKFYDYAVLNDSLDGAVCDIIKIIESEKLKSFRSSERIENIIGGNTL